MSKTIKIQMLSNHLDYKKGQVIELEEKQAINFLTNGKALKIHRTKDEIAENSEEEISETKEEKGNKKSKK
jgi:hypothetical protein